VADTDDDLLTVINVPGLFNPRRFALVLMIVVLLGLAIVPLLLLAPRAAQLANDNAYQGLSAIVQSHNGQVSYNALAAKTLKEATASPGADGATSYAMADTAGVCWTVTVPSGHATSLPVEAPTSYCR
jgi:competence protein ComGC